ncbi:hypothetical protein, partial [Sandarakinorhabdus sp.]|uniref:hypothetical protein n=1 Tax=Sandarakinorhabdus sp. TaxID=1916663 RepID=UPI0038F6028C
MSLAPAMDAAAAPAGRGASRSAALRAALRTALMPPGSLTWLVAHDVRLKVRGRQSGLARLIGVLVLGLLPLGGGVAAAVLLMAEPDVPSRALGSLGAVTVALVLVMLSSAFAHVLRALRDRGELELLLSAPVPPSRVLAARALGIASVVALPFLILVTPFCVVAALTGHPGWLGGMAVVLIMAAIATSAAFLLADGLERLLGPARARVFAQVAGVMLGASVFALGQAPNFAPDWFSAQMDALRAVPPSPFDWPGRAILGAPLPLLALAALGVLLSVLAARVAARGLIHAPVIAAPGKAQQRRAAHSFRAGVPRALVTKELRLIARDPELISQIGQQMVFLVPVLAVIFTGGEITGARMAAAAG